MFDLVESTTGERVLVYTKRPRRSGERGLWVEICHEELEHADFYVRTNKEFGLQVELDDYGFYRALVLKD